MEGRISTTSIGQGKQAQGGVMGSLGRREFYLVCFPWEEEENQYVREKLVVMCEELLFMEKMCANKRAGKEVVCNK